jgi:diguanylate cyclase (GGDEF)-like protein/PAS domain S-box-containing protein
VICDHLQYSKEELIGKDNRQYQTKENSKKAFQKFVEVYMTGNPVKAMEMEVIRKDGTIQISEVSISLIRNAEGTPISFRGTSRDITGRKQMEEQLRQSEEKYRSIIENMQEPYFENDLEGNFTFVNDAVCERMGYTREKLIGLNYQQFTDKEAAKKSFEAYNRIYRTGEPIRGIEQAYTRKDGINGFAELSVSLIRDAEGKPIGFRGFSYDITERKQAEETIRQSEERYRAIIEQMEEGYFELDLAGNFTFVNDAECRNLGYFREKLIGMNYKQYADEKNAKALYRLFTGIYKTGIPVKAYDLDLIKKDGTKSFDEISASLIKNAQGKPIGFRGISRDVTERKNAEARIQYLATHDNLTGLSNRLMFSQLLNHAIQSAKRNKRQLAVLFIDLDRFKIINDTMGHDVGDQLLQEIARRFKQSLRAVDVVGRLGGDEFVVLIEEVNESSQIAIVAHKILTTTIKPMILLGEECRITASIGISIYPKDGEGEQSLMKNADMAMYFAKEAGKNNYQFYSKDIQSQSAEHLGIETNLRSALERKEFSLHYQAKVDFKTGLITGVEALLRWDNPSLGSVTPTQFIPVAEETGLIVPIGRWVIKTACAQNVAWQRQGLPPVCVAVNLSLRQIMDDNLLKDIKAALVDSGMAPNLLELEITESMMMHNPARLIGVLADIKELGVRLAIDDFGTGYSSLSQIKHFPIDTLKVDRSFIRNLPQDPEDKAITEAIIAMGKTLSLTVVAEGVETQEQEDFLREHICDEMQGFYFSKPIAPDQFADLLRKHNIPSQK